MFSPKTTYKIIRFRFNDGRPTIKGGLTLEKAHAHRPRPKAKAGSTAMTKRL
jgi:hypothetical protein